MTNSRRRQLSKMGCNNLSFYSIKMENQFNFHMRNSNKRMYYLEDNMRVETEFFI
jgi:coproporphyrinogen III oxidase-like Fe-S oxidoreductase